MVRGLVGVAMALAVSGFAPSAPVAPETVIRVEGVITRAVEARLMDAFDRLERTNPVTLELSSPGGFTAAGHAIIDRILAERRAGRAIATRVRGGEACESMCVGLFLAGYPRTAAPDAEFMVHAPRLYDNGYVPLRATAAMVDRLQSLGASPDWIARVRKAGGFSGTVDHRETARDLVAEGSNVVTELLR